MPLFRRAPRFDFPPASRPVVTIASQQKALAFASALMARNARMVVYPTAYGYTVARVGGVA